MILPENLIPKKRKNPLFDGERIKGTAIRSKNSRSVESLANILKSSLGPKGLDKMMVDEAGSITVTNDGATILGLLDVVDPAARLVVELSRSQDTAAGDGTTSVAILAAELIKRGFQLVEEGVHAAIVTAGFVKAKNEASKFISSELTINTKDKSGQHELLTQAIKTSLSSKAISVHSEVFAQMVAEAVTNNFFSAETETQVLLRAGSAISDSRLFDGYAFVSRPVNELLFRDKEQRLTKLCGHLVLCAFGLKPKRMELGVKINLENPETVNKLQAEEQEFPLKLVHKVAKEKFIGILSMGVISIPVKRLCEKLGLFALENVEYKHLHALSLLLNSRIHSTIENFLSEENGRAEDCEAEVFLEPVEEEVVFVAKPKKPFAGKRTPKSILLRGPNEYTLAEVERSLHDAIEVAKNLVSKQNSSEGKVVAGGGSVESASSAFLLQLADSFASQIRLPIKTFGEALMVIPETLAVNAGKSGVTVCALLRENFANFVSNDEEEKSYKKYMGVCGKKSKLVEDDMAAKGIVEPVLSKLKQLEIATEAALSILRIDECIELYPDEKQKQKQG